MEGGPKLGTAWNRFGALIRGEDNVRQHLESSALHAEESRLFSLLLKARGIERRLSQPPA